MVRKVAVVESPCKRNNFWKRFDISSLAVVKLPCKRKNFSKRFEISNRFELFWFSCKRALRASNFTNKAFVSVLWIAVTLAFSLPQVVEQNFVVTIGINKSRRPKVSCKIILLKSLAKLTKNHLSRLFFHCGCRSEACNLIKKETPTEVFSCKFDEI